MHSNSTEDLLKNWDKKSTLEAIEILCKARHAHTLKELLLVEKDVEHYLIRHPLVPEKYRNKH